MILLLFCSYSSFELCSSTSNSKWASMSLCVEILRRDITAMITQYQTWPPWRHQWLQVTWISAVFKLSSAAWHSITLTTHPPPPTTKQKMRFSPVATEIIGLGRCTPVRVKSFSTSKSTVLLLQLIACRPAVTYNTHVELENVQKFVQNQIKRAHANRQKRRAMCMKPQQ